MRSTMAWFCAAALSGALACGGEEPPQNPDANPGDSFLPLVTGATWTYRITDNTSGVVADKVSTVGPLEDVGGLKAGVMAYRVTTEKIDGTTVSWQEDTGLTIVRHREQSFSLPGGAADAGPVTADGGLGDAGLVPYGAPILLREEWYEPFKLRLDETPEHLVAGAIYVQSYNELVTGSPMPVAKSETWEVIAVNQSVTVPAGTFNALVLRRTAGVGQADKTYWFVRGVGKVKEEGGQREELVSYTIP